MPSAWEARSRARSSLIEAVSGPLAMAQGGRDAVAILTVKGAEGGEHGGDARDADAIGPGEGSERVIHALAHGQVYATGIGDAKVHSIRGLVGQHGDGAHDRQTRQIAQAGNGNAGRLQGP